MKWRGRSREGGARRDNERQHNRNNIEIQAENEPGE